MKNWPGFCPICQQITQFVATNDWYRDVMTCTTCDGGSVPRERALALVLEEVLPHWRDIKIHESSPVDRGISRKLRSEAPEYIASQYFPEQPRGTLHGYFRNEDLQNLTFESESHHLFVSLDVFEHIPNPKAAICEIYRTLKPGGVMLSTFPVRKWQVDGIERRVEYGQDGEFIHVKEPEYHGNPINPAGSIVTVDYGYDFHQLFSEWAPFNVRVYRFADAWHGILGEYTEVVLCKKPRNETLSRD